MDESKHIFHEGKWYARVSAIVSEYSDPEFSAALKDKNSSHYHAIKAKAEIGTAVHQAIDCYLNDGFPAPGIKGEPYFISFLKWFERMDPEIISLEERIFDDSLMITGQIDGVFRMKHSPYPIIVDYKTSAKESPTWIMQGHLYNYLCTNQGLKLEDRVLFLKLSKDALIPQVYEYKITANMMNICLDAVHKFHQSQQSACE